MNKIIATKPLLQVLLVEDNVLDAELVVCALEDAGYRLTWTRVETEAEYLAALATAPDIILSDYSLPHFSGTRALALLGQSGQDIPFIIISGTIGEDTAAEAMIAGARDYILKTNLVRLAPAVQRELQQCTVRRERREARERLAQQTHDLRERVKELTCLYEISRLAQQSDLALDDLLQQAGAALVKAYQWPEITCARIVHGQLARQTPNFQLTKWRQEARTDLAHSESVTITVCYLEQGPWPEGQPFLAEERLMLEAVALRIGDSIRDRRLRAALAASERNFHATFSQAAVGIVHTSLDKRYLEVNQKFCDMTGYARDELLGMDTANIAHPDDRVDDDAHRKLLIEGRITTYVGEKRYVRKDGTVFLARRTVSLARDSAGQPMHFIRVIEDVTERRQLEMRMEQTFDQAAVGIVRADLERNIIDINRKFCEMTGYSREELLGMSVKQISHPDDLAMDAEARARLLAGEIESWRSEKRYVRKDGSIIWVRRTTSLARDVTGSTPHYILVVEDITERKAAEESYRTTFDHAPVGIMHTTGDRRILQVNRKLCEILGYTREELLNLSTADILPPEYMALDRPKYFDRMLRGELQSHSSERPFIRKDGSYVWTNRTVSLVRDAAGQPLYFLRIIEDITERKRAESALLESERFAISTIDALSEHLCVLDETGVIVAVNKAWRDFATDNGMAADLVGPGTNYLAVCDAARGDYAAEGPVIAAGIRAVLGGERDEFTLEYPCHSPSGQRWFLAKAVPFHGTGQRRIVVTHENITARKLAEQELKKSERRFRAIFDHAGVGISMRRAHDRTSPWLQVNDRFCELLGYAREELLTLSTADITHPEDQSVAVYDNQRLLRGEIRSYTREKRLIRKDGSSVWVVLAVSALPDSKGLPEYFIATYQDISMRKRAEEALQESDEKFRQLANNTPQVFWMTDVDQKAAIYVSPAYEAITGRGIAELQSDPRNWLAAVHEEDRDRVKRARKEKAAHGNYDMEYRVVHTDGTVRWIHDRAFPVRNAAGEVFRIAGIGEDITERKRTQDRLLHLAHYDVLTSLPNRVLFHDRLRQALAQARRNDWIVGVLFLDLDRFKMVNDTLGHALGDHLLQQVSERLKRCVRVGDTVGRLGGDEFALVLSELAAPQDARLVAQKILDALTAPFHISGHEIFVTASIGITLYPSDSEDIDTLISNADAAMFSAKDQGRNNYQFYTQDMNQRIMERMQLENKLRRALERNEFVLHYQPKVDIASGSIAGVEALLRWQPPENGLVAPGSFIPLLEDTGLIVPVGEWVLREACAQIRRWQQAGLQPTSVAVNLSARQLQQPGFDVTLRKTIEEFGIEPRWIELEITESSLMINPEEACMVLANIGRLGVRLSVDDFGTGYSSLTYLKRFPLDALKIDRSFVHDIALDPEDAAITRSVIMLAHSLDLKVVAEGVENEEQLAYLSAHGCDEAQGYLFSRPLPAAECTALLEGGRRMHLPANSSAAEASPSVLVVDDDENCLALARHLLERDGHRVLTAGNTHGAFELLAKHRVDAVVSDQNMPDMPGVEFLRRVRLMYPNITRIMLSGAADFQTAASAINKGEVHRFFVKGRDDELLRNDIGRILWRNGTRAPVSQAHSEPS